VPVKPKTSLLAANANRTAASLPAKRENGQPGGRGARSRASRKVALVLFMMMSLGAGELLVRVVVVQAGAQGQEVLPPDFCAVSGGIMRDQDLADQIG
jgi:hypothetical protein